MAARFMEHPRGIEAVASCIRRAMTQGRGVWVCGRPLDTLLPEGSVTKNAVRARRRSEVQSTHIAHIAVRVSSWEYMWSDGLPEADNGVR